MVLIKRISTLLFSLLVWGVMIGIVSVLFRVLFDEDPLTLWVVTRDALVGCGVILLTDAKNCLKYLITGKM